jgi:membrane protein YqaA with SNARE-associated domain
MANQARQTSDAASARTSASDAPAVADAAAALGRARADAPRFVLQAVLAIGLLVALFAGLAAFFRAPLEALGQGFVARFGPLGMALGTFVADGFHVPLPPQFYLFAAITGGGSQVVAVAAVCAGSIAGGNAGFWIAQHASRFPRLERLLTRSRGPVDRLFGRYGWWAVALGSVLPVPYSVLCYLAGAYRMPYRVFALLALFRIPRLVFFYYLIRAGWGLA